MSKCIHANKLHDNLWCSTACMYCTLSQEETCRHRKDIPVRKVVKTNADHIRCMTDEELLGCLLELQDTAIKRFANFELPNYQWMADWLKQPYGGDT